MRARLWHNRLGVALGINAGLMLAVLVCLTRRPGETRSTDTLRLGAANAAFAQSVSPAVSPNLLGPSGTSSLVVMPGQLAPNIYGCYLLDPARDSLCVYEYFHSDGLKLVAARNIAYDRKLQNFNTAPAPSEVKSLAQSSPASPDIDH